MILDRPHRRYNPLLREWVLVSPQRTQRPWRGQVERAAVERRPALDPECYLCPGNLRAGGVRNPPYEHTFVFVNDFSPLLPDTPCEPHLDGPLLRAQSLPGECRVICFSPRHDLTLPEMPRAQICRVVDVWTQQVLELGEKYRWVQIFENKGEIMGCSNAHPHGQVWAQPALPQLPAREDRCQQRYHLTEGLPLLWDYLQIELQRRERLVVRNETWVALVPFWAVWPFETLLLPRRHVQRLPDLDESERDGLADILKRLLTRYDNLFGVSFPYSMGWHGAPTLDEDQPHWQLHAHFLPPLLRSAGVKKFMVGYEMLAEPQRDITAEEAAARLREMSEVHSGAGAQP